ncbi:MAG: acyltransferase [Bacteriovorax sp.]|nr:acyltransferase [Bacteriovorax sp.]
MLKTHEENHSLMIPAAMPWLRLIAIFLVFTGHSELGFGRGQGSVFFLVLSGYTFTRFFIKEWGQTGTLQIKIFIKKRFTKIIPALYAVVLINVLIKLFFHRVIDYSQVASVLTFTCNYYNAFHDHTNTGFSHFWTVSMMIQFYIVWPLLFIYLAGKTKSRFQMTSILSLIVLTVIFYRTFLVCTHLGSDAYIYNAFETRIDSFLIGAIFAININHRYFQKVREYAVMFKWTFIPVIVSIALMSELPLPLRNSFGFDLHSILIGLLIVQLSAFGQKLTKTPEFIFQTELLGEITYWFYLLHPWGIYAGKALHTNAYIQVISGGFFILGSLTILCLVKKRGFKSLFQLPNLIRKPSLFLR